MVEDYSVTSVAALRPRPQGSGKHRDKHGGPDTTRAHGTILPPNKRSLSK